MKLSMDIDVLGIFRDDSTTFEKFPKGVKYRDFVLEAERDLQDQGCLVALMEVEERFLCLRNRVGLRIFLENGVFIARAQKYKFEYIFEAKTKEIPFLVKNMVTKWAENPELITG